MGGQARRLPEELLFPRERRLRLRHVALALGRTATAAVAA